MIPRLLSHHCFVSLWQLHNNFGAKTIKDSDYVLLFKYAELYEKGLLTKDEFDLKKSELLSNKSTVEEHAHTEDEIVQIEESTNRFCPNCGSEVEIDSKFCSDCGFKL